MYTLTLTHEERKAIDWVGHRYMTGYWLYALLWLESDTIHNPDVEWDDKIDITFSFPEYIAWRVKEKGEMEDNLWPCFSTELKAKMQAFVDSIV